MLYLTRMVCACVSLHMHTMHTMFTGGAQALGTTDDAAACHQNGLALWRHLALLLRATGKQVTQKQTAKEVDFDFSIGIVLG